MFFSSLVLLQWVTFIFQYGSRMNSLTIYEDGRRFLFLKTPVDLKMELTMKAISRLHNESIQKPEGDITVTLSLFIHCQCWRPRSRKKSWQGEEFKETTKKKKGKYLSFRLFPSCVVTAKSLACLFFVRWPSWQHLPSFWGQAQAWHWRSAPLRVQFWCNQAGDWTRVHQSKSKGQSLKETMSKWTDNVGNQGVRLQNKNFQ